MPLAITLRPERATDYATIAQLLIDAFGQVDEARLVERLRLSDAYIPALSLVAVVADQVVGHVLFSRGHLTGQASRRVLVLAPLAVAPSHQRQGVGQRLVKAGLAIAQERHEALVTVLGHPDYYRQFGFEPAAKYGITSPFPVPEEAFMVKRLDEAPLDLAGLLHYAPAFGALIEEVSNADSDRL